MVFLFLCGAFWQLWPTLPAEENWQEKQGCHKGNGDIGSAISIIDQNDTFCAMLGFKMCA